MGKGRGERESYRLGEQHPRQFDITLMPIFSFSFPSLFLVWSD